MAETLHIYSRVSTKSQEDNTSLEQQRSKGKALAELLGMDHKIWDEGVASSSSDDIEEREVRNIGKAFNTGATRSRTWIL